jgi:NifB/MoaA-like Fe-S oxidoreductase
LFKLQECNLGDGILLPSIMLKHGELIFLDDISIEEVALQLKTKIFPVAGVEELIQACIS